jgi:hypothetical protein
MADVAEAPDATQAAQVTPEQQAQAAAVTAPPPAAVWAQDGAPVPGMPAGQTPNMPAPAAPQVQPRSGLAGIVDQFKEAIAPHGWGKAVAEAIHGAGAGMAASKGAGNQLQGLNAGFEAGQHDEKQFQQQQQAKTAAQRQATLDQFNDTMLKQKIIANQFDLTHMKQAATAQDVGFEKDRVAEEDKLGSSFLGQYSDAASLPEVQQKHPGVLKDFYNKNDVQVIPHIDPQTGLHDGVSVYLRRPGLSEALLPPGQKVTTATMDPKGNWQLGSATTSAPMTQAELDAANNAAHVKVGAQQNLVATTAYVAKKQAADLEEQKAKTAKAYAQAGKAIAEANKAKATDVNDPSIATLGEMVAKGGLTQDQLSKMKGGALTAVQSYLAEHHPNLDQTSVFLTAAERKQRDLAENSLQNVGDIGAILQRRPDLLGVIQGRLTQGKTLAGTNDKDLGAINEILDNFGLATTGTHGTKAQAAREDARTALLNGFKNGPDATQAAIAAAQRSLQNLASAGKPKGINGEPYVYNSQPAGGANPTSAPAATGMVTVQIPGLPAGQIPASAVAQFQKDHPNATVSK